MFHPPVYFGKEVRGKVIDGDGKPIAGAVVVLTLVVREYLFIHGSEGKPLLGLEAVTDSNGLFIIPEWVIERKPFGTRIKNRTPIMRIFKNGYRGSKVIRNKKKSFLNGLSFYVPFEPSNNVYILDKYQSLEEQKLDWFKGSGAGLIAWGYPPYSFECGWEKFPKFIAERKKVIESLKKVVSENDYRYLGKATRGSSNNDTNCKTKIAKKEKEPMITIIKGTDVK